MKKLLFFLILGCYSLNFVAQDTLATQIGSYYDTKYPGCLQPFLNTQVGSWYYIIDTLCTEILNEDTLNISNISGLQSKDVKYFKNLNYLSIYSCTYASGETTPLILPNKIKHLSVNDFYCPHVTIAPDSLETLVLNGVIKFNYLPNGLKNFSYYNNFPSNINTKFTDYVYPNTPDSLEDFYYYNLDGGVDTIYALPSFENAVNLKSFSITSSVSPYGFIKFPKFAQDSKLKEIWMYSCNFDSVKVDYLPEHLSKLNLVSVPTTYIDGFPPYLQHLYLQTSVQCLPVLPETLKDAQFNGVACLPNYVPYSNYTGMMLCSEFNPANCSPVMNNIKGHVYYDVNCVNSGSLKDIPLVLLDGQNNFVKKIYSDNYGDYGFSIPDGTYIVKVDTSETTFRKDCSNYEYEYTFTMDASNPYQIQDFQLTCDTIVANLMDSTDSIDVEVGLINLEGVIRPGSVNSICFGLKNKHYNEQINCTYDYPNYLDSLLSFEVKFTGPISYIDTNSNYSFTQNNDTLQVNFTDQFSSFYNGFYNNFFCFQTKTDTLAQIGDAVCVTVTVKTPMGDIDLTNNTLNRCFQVVNSYDPNMKETYPFIMKPGYDDEIRYTVHFQNTGNAPAINVMLIDTLDGQLDLKTFKVIHSSHDVSTSLDTNRLIFRFTNINLADSLSDPEGSKGYVEYSIKPKNPMQVDEKIYNTAYIYFDFNDPIITNTSVNWCTNSELSVDEFTSDRSEVIVYPNPLSNERKLTIKRSSNKGIEKVQLYNLSGQKITEFGLTGDQNTFDLHELKAGIYLLYFESTSGKMSKKLVVM